MRHAWWIVVLSAHDGTVCVLSCSPPVHCRMDWFFKKIFGFALFSLKKSMFLSVVPSPVFAGIWCMCWHCLWAATSSVCARVSSVWWRLLFIAASLIYAIRRRLNSDIRCVFFFGCAFLKNNFVCAIYNIGLLANRVCAASPCCLRIVGLLSASPCCLFFFYYSVVPCFR